MKPMLTIWSLVKGDPGAKSPQEAYFFYWGEELQAVRMGRWKLHFPHAYRRLAGREGGTDGRPAPYEEGQVDLALFDLENDIGETTDVKDQHPEIVVTIEKLADRMRDDLGNSARKMNGSGRRDPGRLAENDPRYVVREGFQTLAEPE
jgi:arylsulfatase A